MTNHSSRDGVFARDIRLPLAITDAKPSQGTVLVALFALAAVILPSGPTWAQSATWLANPGSADYDTGSNWNPATVPTDTATFGTSATSSLTFSSPIDDVGGWTFNAGASNYTFTIGAGAPSHSLAQA